MTDEEDGDGNEGTEESCCPDWYDFFAHWVGKLGVDYFAVLEVDWEGARGGGVCGVYLGGVVSFSFSTLGLWMEGENLLLNQSFPLLP